MNKKEFETRVGQEVNAEDYKIVELVYAYHPLISEVDGKEQVASLYKLFGVKIFKEMKPRAMKARGFEEEILRIRGQMAELEAELRDNQDALSAMRKYYD